MKKILAILLLIALMFALCGCETVSDNPLATNATNTKAYIKVNDKTIVVDVKQYLFGSNGVVIVYGSDGMSYKTHSVNIVLVKDSNQP